MTHRAAVVRAAAGMASLLALAVLPVSSALAVVPSAARVRAEIARSNVQAGRAQPLALEVRLVGESGEAIASGRARLDPNGFARLELTLSDGRREIHERSPAGYVTTRDGRKVDRALPLLPPTQLLQAPTEAEVAAALLGIGGDPELVELGMSGGADCWVLGGRDPGPFEANRRPSHWFDLEDRRAVRIDDPAVARFRLGPPAAPPGAIAFPAWIDVESPGWPRRRLDIQRVEPADPAPRLRSP
jgi:hypothetical protein